MASPKKRVARFVYRLREEGGMEVARVDAATDDDALREIQHYAFMYAQDGPVVIEQKTNRKWKPVLMVAMREHVGLK